MAKTRIQYIEGASKTYPQWDQISEDTMRTFRGFHKDLRDKGYNVRCANIAEKGGLVYWIVLTNCGDYELQHFGYLNRDTKERKKRVC